MSVSVRRGLLAAGVVLALTIGFAPALEAQNPTAAPDANASLAAKGEWNATTTYAMDDIVTARGSAWISLKANNKNRVPGQTSPSTANWWQLFARGFNPRGAWSNAVTYQPDELVTQNGQTYRAKLTNLNRSTTNTTIWETLAAKGATGATGPQGPPGTNTGIGAGTQSTPSISFAGDPDTGIFSPGQGQIALVENGVRFLHNIGNGNIAFGKNTLAGSNNGVGNTAIGNRALMGSASLSAHNVGVGEDALTANTDGSENTAIGRRAQFSNTTGRYNTAVGSNALAANTTFHYNTAIGTEALLNTAGPQNTAVGYQALWLNKTGANNVGVGAAALISLTTGMSNIAIGTGAGAALTTQSNNIYIGNGGGGPDSNTIHLGNIAHTATFIEGIAGATVDGRAVFIDPATGRLGLSDPATVKIGTSNTQAIEIGGEATQTIDIGTSPSGVTQTIRIGTSYTQQMFAPGIRSSGVTGGQTVSIDANGQLGINSSSRRYKYDIAVMADVSDMLSKLRPVSFRYKKAESDGSHPLDYGLIAEEVADVFPDLAVFKAGQPETVKYHLLPSFLLAGYQAQQKTIAAQAAEIAALRERVTATEALEERVRRIEALLRQTKASSLQ
jgi:hypothetical protein